MRHKAKHEDTMRLSHDETIIWAGERLESRTDVYSTRAYSALPRGVTRAGGHRTFPSRLVFVTSVRFHSFRLVLSARARAFDNRLPWTQHHLNLATAFDKQ
jgi:hypothetical protein